MAASKCEMLWALRYIRRYRPREESIAPTLGTIFHLRAAYWAADRMPNPPDWPAFDEEIRPYEDKYPELVDKSAEMMEAFEDWIRPRPWKIVAVEREFWAPLARFGITGPYASEVVTCRTDLIVESNGAMFIPDFKTGFAKGKKISALPERNEWTMSLQAGVNLRLGRLEYPDLKRFSVLRVKSNGPPWDFRLDTVRIPAPLYQSLPDLLHRAVKTEADIWRKMQTGQPLDRQGVLTGACFGRYGACDYFDVCRAETSEARRAILQEDFKRE